MDNMMFMEQISTAQPPISHGHRPQSRQVARTFFAQQPLTAADASWAQGGAI